MDEKDDFEITVFEEPVTIKRNVKGSNLIAEITIEYCDATDNFFILLNHWVNMPKCRKRLKSG
jgi:hypothetical protein